MSNVVDLLECRTAGDRSGNCIVWDAGTASESWRMKNVHKGHVTALAWFDYNDGGGMAGCFVTGGQVGVWWLAEHMWWCERKRVADGLCGGIAIWRGR